MDTKKPNRSSGTGDDPGRRDGVEKDFDLDDESGNATGERPANAGADFTENAEFNEALESWLDQANAERLPATCTLYKYDHPTTGYSKTQINQYTNEIPDAHTIGMTFGSGRYMALVAVPRNEKQDKLVRSRSFRIHQNYDVMRRQLAFAPGNPPGSVQAPVSTVPLTQSMDTMLGMFQAFMNLIAPLINNRPVPALSPGAEIASVYAGLGKVMQTQALDNMALIADMQRKLTNTPEPIQEGDFEDMDTPPKQPTILEQIAPYLAQFLPALLGKGPIAAATAATVKALPQFRQVVSDPVQVRQLVEYLDNMQGQERTNQVLARLKIPRPVQMAVQPKNPILKKGVKK